MKVIVGILSLLVSLSASAKTGRDYTVVSQKFKEVTASYLQEFEQIKKEMLGSFDDEVAKLKKAKKNRRNDGRYPVKVAKLKLDAALADAEPAYHKAMKKLITLDDWPEKLIRACATDSCVKRIKRDLRFFRLGLIAESEGLYPYNLHHADRLDHLWLRVRNFHKNEKKIAKNQQLLMPDSYDAGSEEEQILAIAKFEDLEMGMESLMQLGVDNLKNPEGKFGKEALACYGLKNILKFGIDNLDRYSLPALQEFGLAKMQEAEKLYGLENLSIYGLKLLQKYTIEELDELADEYGIEYLREHFGEL